MAGPLSGKVALVTGASSGIGRSSAVQLASAGADIALNYLTMPEGAEAAAEEIRKLGRRVQLYRVDVSDQHAVDAMVADAVAKLGRMDVFVSSAVFSEREPFTTADMAGFRKTIDVSMWGAYYGLRADLCPDDRAGTGRKRGDRQQSRTHRSRFRTAWPTTWPRPRSTR